MLATDTTDTHDDTDETVRIRSAADGTRYAAARDAWAAGDPVWIETDTAHADDALGALPPIWIAGAGTLCFAMGEPYSGDSHHVFARVTVAGAHRWFLRILPIRGIAARRAVIALVAAFAAGAVAVEVPR